MLILLTFMANTKSRSNSMPKVSRIAIRKMTNPIPKHQHDIMARNGSSMTSRNVFVVITASHPVFRLSERSSSKLPEESFPVTGRSGARNSGRKQVSYPSVIYQLQGVSSRRGPGLGRLRFGMFQYPAWVVGSYSSSPTSQGKSLNLSQPKVRDQMGHPEDIIYPLQSYPQTNPWRIFLGSGQPC